MRFSECIVIGLFLATVALPTNSVEYRTFDGTGNNKDNPQWGAANTPYLRGNGTHSYPAKYADGKDEPLMMNLPPPRVISNKLFGLHPENKASHPITLLHVYWGQFLDHDIINTPTDPSDQYPISIPPDDPQLAAFGPSMPFSRSAFVRTRHEGPREQINLNTAWVDGSNVYGNTEERVKALRDGDSCKLKMRKTDVGWLLPLNTDGLDMENDAHKVELTRLHAAGDFRANENPGLLALHTLFALEHNRLCDEIAAAHPDWDEETKFQEARRWNVAFLQRITFEEYIPSTIGNPLPLYTGYNPQINPSIDNMFATALFRYGHSEVVDHIPRLDQNRMTIPEGNLSVKMCYHNPECVESAGIEPILIGITAELQNDVDPFYVEGTILVDLLIEVEVHSPNSHYRASTKDLRNFLFGEPSAPLGGIDLAARNIMRGRDHGMISYNEAREFFGLPKLTNFSQITRDKEVVQALEELYNGDIDAIDVYVGSLAEDSADHLTPLGPLLRASLEDQYRRLRDGDRFYFENEDAGFTKEEIAIIQRTRISDIILRNTNIERIQCSAFFYANQFACTKNDTMPRAPATKTPFEGRMTLLDGRLTVEWTVDYDNEEISFNLTAQTPGWVGLGFPDVPGRMLGADAITGWVDDITQQVYIQDRHLLARQEGCPGACEDTHELVNGTSDFTRPWGRQTPDGITQIGFTRKWRTDDVLNDKVIRRGEIGMIFAFGNNDRVSYHGQNKIAVTVELIPIETPPIPPHKEPSPTPSEPGTEPSMPTPSTPSTPSTPPATVPGSPSLASSFHWQLAKHLLVFVILHLWLLKL